MKVEIKSQDELRLTCQMYTNVLHIFLIFTNKADKS